MEHFRLTCNGTYSETSLKEEVWQFGWQFSLNGSSTDDVDVLAASIGPAIKALWNGTGSPIAQTHLLSLVKIARIGSSGRYTQAPGIYDAGNQAGKVSGQIVPVQCAVVITTVASSIYRGPGRFGRFYLPAPTPTFIDTAGKLPMLNAEAYRTFGKALLSTCMTAPANAHKPAHFTSTGVRAEIDEVRCGTIVDTQRRRRNKLTEEYATVSFP